MSQTLLTARNIRAELPHTILFEDISVSLLKGDKVGFVGRNGGGKSTLLKILAGTVTPVFGSVTARTSLYYLPQLEFSLFESEKNISELLLEKGIFWQPVKASLQKLFNAEHLVLERKLSTLSGGELSKLLIAMADATHPEILLLDEPTNHLDTEGLETLKKYLEEFSGAYIVVSHDPVFLDRVSSSIWELENGKLSKYGGNYTAYAEQKEIMEEARERKVEALKKNARKIRRAKASVLTRSARASREDKKWKADVSRDKFATGFFQNRSEKNAGRARERLLRAEEENRKNISELGRPRTRRSHPDLEVGSDTSKRSLVRLSMCSLSVDGKRLLDEIDLRVSFGDRIVLAGGNGTGKSLLAKAIVRTGSPAVLSGEAWYSKNLQTAYIDQKYCNIDARRSVIENMRASNPELDEAKIRSELGRFLLSGESEIRRCAGDLSGGETARLSLAMVTAKPIDLLILDEPTNNLDIETLDTIAEALADFPGAIIVISHNLRFLERLNIRVAYALSGKKFRQMHTLPSDGEEYYEELLRI